MPVIQRSRVLLAKTMEVYRPPFEFEPSTHNQCVKINIPSENKKKQVLCSNTFYFFNF